MGERRKDKGDDGAGRGVKARDIPLQEVETKACRQRAAARLTQLIEGQ